ncbi:MAG: dihydrofolate reductase [Rubrivivax sp.]|nr:dihydrofolate reductase [Rubrivivax sp.]
MKITLVAAVAADGGIGRDNTVLFSDPVDLQHFRSVTAGRPVVMGRKTWLSLPERFRPLPGRRNLVLTRDPGFVAAGAETARSIDEALARLAEAPEVCVIGGADVYAQAMERADELVITHVARHFDGADAFFPPIEPRRFAEVDRREATAADGTPLAFVTYRRR